MKHTILNSKILRRTEEGYREYRIELKKWSEFFSKQEEYVLIIADNSDTFDEEQYKDTYEYIETHQIEILDMLVEHCLMEYNYKREVRIHSCRKSRLEETIRRYPMILNRADAVCFFQLVQIQILPYEKKDKYYVIYDIKVNFTERQDFESFGFSIILCMDHFVITIDTDYRMLFLEQIVREDKSGEALDYITSTHMDYNNYVLREPLLCDITDFSSIHFRGRSIMGKYKELLPHASCLGLREMEGRNSEYGLPPGSTIIGDIGEDGIFFFIVKRLGIKKEEAPIYVVSPMNFDYYVAPIARNLLEFISLGVACRYFGILETISVFEKIDIESQLEKEDRDPNIKEIITLIKNNFPIIPIEDPYDFVKQIQADEILKEEAKKLEKYIAKKLGLDD